MWIGPNRRLPASCAGGESRPVPRFFARPRPESPIKRSRRQSHCAARTLRALPPRRDVVLESPHSVLGAPSFRSTLILGAPCRIVLPVLAIPLFHIGSYGPSCASFFHRCQCPLKWTLSEIATIGVDVTRQARQGVNASRTERQNAWAKSWVKCSQILLSFISFYSLYGFWQLDGKLPVHWINTAFL